nr:transposase insM for insertion sequence element IS600 [Bradyrhizobium sp. DOA9]
MWHATRERSRRRRDLNRNKHRRSIAVQLAFACQPAPREQLACRQPVTSRSHRHQARPAIALGDDPLRFLQCPTAPCARRNDFKSGTPRHRHMISHTPMSSSSFKPRKAVFAGAILPYLLRGMEITRPNQVWAMDITYIPMARGFVYLAVVLDWATRRVLSWRLSITKEAAFCVATLEDALARHGKPEIFNADQARSLLARRSPACSPRTASPSAWTAGSPGGITCSLSGCGAASNTRRFICGPTRKSAKPCLHRRYLDLYNCRRPHSSRDGSTPDQAYFTSLPLRTVA